MTGVFMTLKRKRSNINSIPIYTLSQLPILEGSKIHSSIQHRKAPKLYEYSLKYQSLNTST